MKVTVLANNLNWALSVVARSVAVRPQLPILGNVLLRSAKDGLELMSTDLEMSFRVKVGAKVETEGEVAIPAKVFGELLATIPTGTVEIGSDGEAVKLVSGKIKATMAAMTGGEFPAIPTFKGEADVVIGAEDLKAVMNKVSLSASKDDSRPVFTGILWSFDGGEVKLVATDGYRLGMDMLKVEKAAKKEVKKLIIPARSLQELMRVVEKADGDRVKLKIEEEKQQVIFRWGEVELVSRLIAGDFPPYQQIIPTGFSTRVEFDRAELGEAVKRAAIFARESANIVRFQISDQRCQISANSSQVGSSETEVESQTEGEGVAVAFNSRYLLDYLSAVGAERIELKSEGSLKPGMFGEAGKNKTGFLQIIMPVRVQE